jgi:hypothetical protein
MATKKKLARRGTSKKSGKAREDIILSDHSIYRILSEAIDAVVDEADSIRGVAQSLHDCGGISTGSDASELRSAAGVVRSHALGMLLSVVQVIAKAERIATMADVKASGGAA